MNDIEKDAQKQATMTKAGMLAEIGGEEFVLALTEAYLAGVEKGQRLAAQGAA